jgi:hypothetical protein
MLSEGKKREEAVSSRQVRKEAQEDEESEEERDVRGQTLRGMEAEDVHEGLEPETVFSPINLFARLVIH